MPCTQAATFCFGLLALGRGDVAGLVVALLAVLLGIIMQSLVLLRFYSQAKAPRIGILGYHFGCIMVALMMLEGAYDLIRRRPVCWGGREYILEPR